MSTILRDVILANIKFFQGLLLPKKTQEKVLKNILQENGNTLFAKEQGIHPNMTLQEFQKLPFFPYETYEPYIERIIKGEDNILTKQGVEHIFLTSGTTKTKRIVASKDRKEEVFRTLGIVTTLQLTKYLRAIRGKTLYFPGGDIDMLITIEKEGIKKTIPCGSVSGTYYRQTVEKSHKLLAEKIAVSPDVFNELDSEKRNHLIATQSLPQNVTHIGSANIATINAFFAYVKKHSKELSKELKHKHPTVSRLLKKKEIKKIWPNIKLVSTIPNHTNKEALKETEKYIGKNYVINNSGVMSSEAQLSINFAENKGIFLITETFYEFREIHNNTIKLLHELEQGKTYEAIITNKSTGLWRYMTGDLFTVIKKRGKLPIIAFSGKKETFEVCQDHVHEINITETIKELQLKNNTISQILILADTREIQRTNMTRHAIVLETKTNKELPKETYKKIIFTYDQKLLKNGAFTYGQTRTLEFNRNKAPCVLHVKAGSIEEYFLKKNRTTQGKLLPFSTEENALEKFMTKKIKETILDKEEETQARKHIEDILHYTKKTST